MVINSNVKKSSGRFLKYGLWWMPTVDPVSMEMDCIRHGGQWKKQDGSLAGLGLAHHYRRFQELIWPDKLWTSGPFKNHWADACLDAYLNHTYIGVMGCAGSGKSDSFASNALTDWYCWSDCTTVLVSSTDLKSLELRIWGMIKKYHKQAKAGFDLLPGYLIEGKQLLILDPKTECSDGRDFKNGIIAVACRKGSQFVGLGPMVGIHNKRVRLIADECNLMPRAFLDSASNLSKCEDFKLVGLGNPNETTNAHGFLCEPAVEIGGWEGGIDQTPGTKIWKTKFPDGICLQLPGSDSPNLKADHALPPPFPFLITRKQMEDDGKIWGVDDWHYQMMTDARMPRGQGSRRVLTRQACVKFGAFNPPMWRDTRKTSIAFLDAAYRGVGGNRCVFGELQFGYEANPMDSSEIVSDFINQGISSDYQPKIIALIDLIVVPIKADVGGESPEDQIVTFCRNQCEARAIPPDNLFFDAGMRTSLVTAFCRMWSTSVNSIDCGGKPSETQVSSEIRTLSKDYYSKFITELWFSVRLTVESGQFRGMTEDACSEFSQREWKLVSGNKIEVETKEEMKVKTGRSPDLADAIAVGLFGARKRGFVISKLIPQDEDITQTLAWKKDARDKARKVWGSGSLNYAT